MLDERHGKVIRVVLWITRVWLPLAIAIAGVVLIILGGARTKGELGDSIASTGLVLVGVAVMVWMLNWLFRLSLGSNRDREREEEARRYYDRHGYWPGEGNEGGEGDDE